MSGCLNGLIVIKHRQGDRDVVTGACVCSLCRMVLMNQARVLPHASTWPSCQIMCMPTAHQWAR